jgi:hypothetical protein
VRYLAPDTVAHVRRWLDLAGITNGSIFRSLRRSGLVGGRLDAGDVARNFKRMAKSGVTRPG